MKRLRDITACLLYVVTAITFSSCEPKEIQEINIHILTGLDDVNDSKIETSIKEFIHFFEIDSCNTYVFFPKVTLTRLATKKPKTDTLKVVISAINSMKKNLGTLTSENLKIDYNEYISKFKLSDLPYKPLKEITDLSKKLQSYNVDYYVPLDTKNKTQNAVSTVLDDIKSEVCKNEKSNFTIFLGEKKKTFDEVPNIEKNQTEIKIAKSLEAKMTEIIDVSKSEEDRLLLANTFWKQEFTKNAFVAKYMDYSDKFPKYFGPELGQGIVYFRDRLARYESILKVKVIKTEYSLKDGQRDKISGLHVIEYQNTHKR